MRGIIKYNSKMTCGSWCGCDVSSVYSCSVVAVVCPVMRICCIDIVEQCATSLDTELLCGKCGQCGIVWCAVWYGGVDVRTVWYSVW